MTSKVQVCLSAAQRNDMRKIAAAQGSNLSTWLRTLAVKAVQDAKREGAS